MIKDVKMTRNTNISIELAVMLLTLFSGLALGSSSYWRFNEGSGVTAFDSLGGTHAVIRGNPVWTTGSFGQALHLDGDGDYLEVGPIYGLSAEQTKMLWIYLESFPPDGVYLIDEGGEGNNNWLELYDSNGDGNPQVRAGFDSFNYIDSKAEIKTGCWYHIAAVTYASGKLSIHINGALDSSASDLSADNRPKSIVIGTDSGTRTGCFNGLIDEVAIYDRALSSGQVRQAYQGSVARYRRALDNTRIVIQSLQETIADREEALARLDVVLKKARVTAEALAGFLATDYNPLSNEGSKMITARQKLQAAMMHLEQSRKSLAMSIEQLNGVLRQLGHRFTPLDKESTERPAKNPAEPCPDVDGVRRQQQ